MEIVQALKQWRKEAGLTQAEVAEKISVPQQHIARWENGTRSPTGTTIKKIAEAFNVSADKLLGIERKD